MKRPPGQDKRPKDGGTPRPNESRELTEDERLFLEAVARFKPSEALKAADRKDAAAAKASPKSKDGAGGDKRAAPGKPRTLDLHGLTLEQAQRRVDQFIPEILKQLKTAGEKVRVRIITGKGTRDGQPAGVLAREIHTWVSQRWARHIVSIDASPADVLVGGIPIRGHFDLTLKL